MHESKCSWHQLIGNMLLFSAGQSAFLGLFPSCLLRQIFMGNQSRPFHNDAETALLAMLVWQLADTWLLPSQRTRKSLRRAVQRTISFWEDTQSLRRHWHLPPSPPPVPLHQMASVSDKNVSGTGAPRATRKDPFLLIYNNERQFI